MKKSRPASFEVVNVTPETAAKWLANRAPNRSVRQRRVRMIANDMRNGKYQFNGQPIIFDTNEKLLDGQHRLAAVVEAKIPVKFLIVRQVITEAFETIDSGATRTMGDVLGMSGEENGAALGAALKLLWYYRNSKGKSIGGKGSAQVQNPTHEDLIELLEKEPGIRASGRAVKVGRALGTPSLWVFCHYIFSKIDPTLADLFTDSLADGVNLKTTDPVYLLREQIIKANASRRRMPRDEVAYKIFRAWNLSREGTPTSRLQIAKGGDLELPRVA